MHSTIEKAAKLTVVEGRSTDIRFGKWKAADERLRGLSEERRKRAAGALGSSDPETAADGLTAKADEQPLHHAVSAIDKNKGGEDA
jgi:hypothetical protein